MKFDKKIKYLCFRITGYCIFLGAVLYAIYSSPYNPHPHSVEDIRNWVDSFGTLAPLMYILLYTFRPLLLFPTLLLNLSAGVLFGPYWGVVFLLLGGLGCANFCYLLGRFGGGTWFLENFGGNIGKKVTNYLLCSNSFQRLLWLRTVPVFPYDPVSVIAGSVRFPWKVYVAATFTGMLPGAIAYNFLADSFGTGRFYGAVCVTVLAFGIPFYMWQKRGENKKINERKVEDGKEC